MSIEKDDVFLFTAIVFAYITFVENFLLHFFSSNIFKCNFFHDVRFSLRCVLRFVMPSSCHISIRFCTSDSSNIHVGVLKTKVFFIPYIEMFICCLFGFICCILVDCHGCSMPYHRPTIRSVCVLWCISFEKLFSIFHFAFFWFVWRLKPYCV